MADTYLVSQCALMAYCRRMEDLSRFGWNDGWADKWQRLTIAGTVPARVVADFGTSLKLVTPELVTAELSGILAHYTSKDLVPKVGDWVAVRLLDNGNAVVESIVPRRSEIARKAAGQRNVKQIIAANVDVAFVLLALDNDFSIERLKRYLYQLSVSNVSPVVVLNKADKVDDINPYLTSLESLGLPIIISTATEGMGVEDILSHIGPAQTAILLGSSGVGKSTLTNRLLGREAQATQEVRASDDTGKHTTVHRELFMLPNGGLLIDTPGIRELQLWGTQEDLDDNFDDVAELISQCQYTTCQHNGEVGCAIQAAINDGRLQASHYADYVKMKAELKVVRLKSTVQARLANKKSRKTINRQAQDSLQDDW